MYICKSIIRIMKSYSLLRILLLRISNVSKNQRSFFLRNFTWFIPRNFLPGKNKQRKAEIGYKLHSYSLGRLTCHATVSNFETLTNISQK